MIVFKIAATVLALITAAPVTSHADDLRIGMRIEPVMDSHYFWSGNYVQYYRHYLGFLITLDPQAKLVPSLAEKWEASDAGWTFHLRPNVRFSDGSAFTASDVVASYKRAREYPNAAGSYAGLFANVTTITAVDPFTVRIETSAPSPTLAFALSQVPVIPSGIAETATQADFATTKASVSIGPHRFVSFAAGQELVLERNPDYWGERPRWDRVHLRIMPEPSARTAALLAGDVDVIGGVPPEFVDFIKADGNFAVFSAPSMRAVFVAMDQARTDASPFVTDNNGAPLPANPFKDKRVREALSLSIDRQVMNERVMNGLSFPSGQIVAKGLGGYSSALAVPSYDPARAKALLATAGYPDGFKITLHCPNDRWVNDAKICQALGQMFSRVGVRTAVSALPSAAYFKLTNQRPYGGVSVSLSSWGTAGSGEADVLTQVLQTYDAEKKTGAWNYSGYSNPEVDRIVRQSAVTIDNADRWALEASAMELAMRDFAVLPLHDQSVVVATRKPLTFEVNSEELTDAMSTR